MNQVNNIKNELIHLSNPAIAEHSLRFFKTGKGEYAEGDQFLGIRVPILRKLAKKYRGISIDEAFELLQSVYHEQRLLALFFLIDLFKYGTEEDQTSIYHGYLKHIRFINNWDLVDSSAQYIVGAYLSPRDKQPIYRLATSSNLWERRIAILSTFFDIKQNKFEHAIRISEILLTDKEDLIHKAVGWMLREIGKRDISVERKFLDKHHNVMPRTMLRYAIEKFPKQERGVYLY